MLKICQQCVCGRGSAPDPTEGAYSAPPDPLAKGEGSPGVGPHPEEGPPGRRGGGREGEGAGRGKIVATRCQILRLKCEDALYKYTDLLTYLLTSVRYDTIVGI